MSEPRHPGWPWDEGEADYPDYESWQKDNPSAPDYESWQKDNPSAPPPPACDGSGQGTTP